MPTLHIEHAISDLPTWFGAFNRFTDARQNAGVTAERVHQPIDDDKYIVVQLSFDTVEAAEAFKSFLESVVWQSRDLSPGLAGTPRARVLREASYRTPRNAHRCRVPAAGAQTSVRRSHRGYSDAASTCRIPDEGPPQPQRPCRGEASGW